MALGSIDFSKLDRRISSVYLEESGLGLALLVREKSSSKILLLDAWTARLTDSDYAGILSKWEPFIDVIMANSEAENSAIEPELKRYSAQYSRRDGRKINEILAVSKIAQGLAKDAFDATNYENWPRIYELIGRFETSKASFPVVAKAIAQGIDRIENYPLQRYYDPSGRDGMDPFGGYIHDDEEPKRRGFGLDEENAYHARTGSYNRFRGNSERF